VNGITKTLKDSVRLTENMAIAVEEQAILSRARHAEITRFVSERTFSCAEHQRQHVSPTISEFDNVGLPFCATPASLDLNYQVHTISFADMRTTGVLMHTKDGSRICHGLLYRPRVEAILIRFYDPPRNATKVFLGVHSNF
jgi:hypothetical protein